MPRHIPEDPMVRNIIRLLNQQQFSRRQLLRGAGIAGAGAGALSLAACGTGDGGGGGGDEIIWGNWTYYLDFDEETRANPSLDVFNETSDFKVRYVEDIDDNNTFYGKIKDALQLDQFTGYDVITMTDPGF
ncbi:MAG: hypothetical protein ACTIJ6_06205 [Leucobacter sp.]